MFHPSVGQEVHEIFIELYNYIIRVIEKAIVRNHSIVYFTISGKNSLWFHKQNNEKQRIMSNIMLSLGSHKASKRQNRNKYIIYSIFNRLHEQFSHIQMTGHPFQSTYIVF